MPIDYIWHLNILQETMALLLNSLYNESDGCQWKHTNWTVNFLMLRWLINSFSLLVLMCTYVHHRTSWWLLWISSHHLFSIIILTHWGWMMHICSSNLTIIGWDNDLLSGRSQAIIWINAGILLIWPIQTNFNEILIENHTFSFKKIH